MTGAPPPPVLDAYRPPSGAYDEMLGPDRAPRRHWQSVLGSLESLGTSELERRRAETDRLLADDGVTYHRFAESDVGGLSEIVTIDTAERRRAAGDDRWRLDPVPLVLESTEWRHIEEGLIQRAELLDAVLTDLYGARQLVHRRVVPPELVFGHPGYLRPAHGVRLVGPHQLFTLAVDLARNPDGEWHVLADRTQAPSGAGYALENRTVTSRVFPSLYRDAQVHRLAPFFRTLRSSLQEVAPTGADDPRIVLLTPGPHSETAFEHGLLASTLGYPLVVGSDLVVRDGRVWLRALGRLEPVDVILRRLDAGWSDPLELRPDSELGVPGLVEACRQGRVSVVNTLGSGVLENPALMAFLPRLATTLLGEQLRLACVPTWWCGEPESLAHVLANLDRLVLKPIARPVGPGAVMGSGLSAAQLDDLRRRVTARPHEWVGQAELSLPCVPALTDEGLSPRRMVLRSFLVSRRGSYVAMTGGLARVADGPEAGRIIANQSGAWSKDTWILSSEPEVSTGFWLEEGPPLVGAAPEQSVSARAGENLFWLSRYAERAEDAVRLLRVVHDRRNEFQHAANPAGTACLTTLYQALTHVTTTYPGFVGGDIEHPTQELSSLVFDAYRPGSVAYAVHAVMASARTVRDQLSLDTWSVLAGLERDLAEGDRGGDRTAVVVPTLTAVLQRLLALAGLEAESLVRDAGWRFQDAGRRVERSIHLASLLRVTLTIERDTATDSLLLESVLTAAESIITYRRRYRSKARVATVLDLLLLDATNPRSIAYQLQRLTEAAASFPSSAVFGRLDEVQRLVLETSTALRVVDTATLAETAADGTRPALDDFLWHLVDRLMAIADAIDRLHFTHQLPQRKLA